jgi:hypothetical protein
MPADAGVPEIPEKLFERLSAADCAALVNGVTYDPASLTPLMALKGELARSGGKFNGDELERALLRHAASVTEAGIGGLPVHESVRSRLREEFRFYTQPPAIEDFEAGGYLFATGCQTISLRRFPAGPMDWEIDGIPRSLLLQIPKRDLPRVALFIALKLRGFYPLFLMHVARRPKNRSLLIKKEVLRAYFRMARSLELQPSIKGIMACAWFHGPEARAGEPHLACLSKPYLEWGGLIVSAGPAGADAGFLEHNAARKEQLEAGKLSYRLGLALWPRRQAIAWARAHPELETLS